MKIIFLCLLCLAAVTVSAVPVRLDNGIVEAEIDAGLGRITVWRLKNGSNLLWCNNGDLRLASLPGWKNYGGDKLWVLPQNFREFAYGCRTPDPDTDGVSWELVSHTTTTVELKSPLNRATGTVAVRRIALQPGEARLTVENRIRRVSPSPLPVQLWAVTQAVVPRYAIMDCAPDIYPQEKRYWKMRANLPRTQAVPLGKDAVKITIPPGDWDKFGAFGRFIAAVYDDAVFLQTTSPEVNGSYPEKATIQFFGSDNYVEMETYGSYVHLKTGETSINHVEWRILPLTPQLPPAAVMDIIKKALTSWTQVGPGGGGRTMWCQPVPGRPDTLISTGDMGGVFFSSNGGRDWRFLPSEEIERVGYLNGNPWTCIAARPGEMWTGSKTRGLLKSIDYGVTWQAVAGPWDKLTIRDWHHSLGPTLVRFSPDGKVGLAFWNVFGDAREKKLFASVDAGHNWKEITVSPVPEQIKEFSFLNNRQIMAVGTAAVGLIDAVAGTQRQLDVQFPGKISHAVATAYGALAVAVSDGGRNSLFKISFDGTVVALPLDAIGSDLRISALAAQGKYFYVAGRLSGGRSSVWKSTDSGKSWQAILERNPGMPECNISLDRWTSGRWGWGTAPASICLDSVNPEIITFTDYTMCGISRNGGRSWDIISTAPLKNGYIPGGGMPMLTGWNYYISGNWHYVATTDFAGWYSVDGGTNWSYAPPEKAMWHNNIYAVAVDPANPAHLWAAASLKHDLPYWHQLINPEAQLWRGGVIESFDRGVTWKEQRPAQVGLPDLPATDIKVDRNGTLYLAMLDGGVFQRGAKDASWRAINQGLPEDNRHVLRLAFAPDGSLYCVITAKWVVTEERAIAGGIYRFAVTKACWDKITMPAEMVFPVWLSFSRDGSRMYISCFQQWREKLRRGTGVYGEPGLWVAGPDGQNPRKIFTGHPVFSAQEHPARPGYLVLATVGGGLMISLDDGRSWEKIYALPPNNIHTVSFAMENDDVWVTTFGQGIWRGKLPR